MKYDDNNDYRICALEVEAQFYEFGVFDNAVFSCVDEIDIR